MPSIPEKNGRGKKKDERTPFLKLFELFGFDFTSDGPEAEAEECIFCGKPGKFYLNSEEGTYNCKHGSCNESGNAYSFINWVYEACLEETTDEQLHTLRDNRNLPLQTLKRHGFAWNGANGCWLLPHKSQDGKIQNITRYYPEPRGKYPMPGLPLRLYGLDKLRDDPKRTLFVCEGPFDAIALDHHLRDKKTRDRYDIIAVPGANVFNAAWGKYLKGRTTRLVFDNDDAGRKGQERIVKLLRKEKIASKISTLIWPSGHPEKADIGDLIKDGVCIAEFTNTHCIKSTGTARRIKFIRGDKIIAEPIEWMWPGHIPFGTFVSLSGQMGTQKSTIARAIAAKATSGERMPNCESAMDPFEVMYLTSEDGESVVNTIVRLNGGDVTRLHVYDVAGERLDEEPIDLLEHLEELETQIKDYGARLVVFDALNSFVGGDISTDSRARRSLSGRLQALARRTGACVIGIRNWGRGEGTASQKALGAASLSDVARCVMNTLEVPPLEKGGPRRFELHFEKVSDAPRPEPIPYDVADLSGTDGAEKYWRKIVWMKPESEQAAAVLAGLDKRRNGSAKRVAKRDDPLKGELGRGGR